MPSKQHQRILSLVTRRMVQLGYAVVACDGSVENLGLPRVAVPEVIGRHRPDVVGRAADGSVCIGEAKTADDVAIRRTREQLEDYLTPLPNGHSHVILGYPQSADKAVRSVLLSLGAVDLAQLVLLPVADELLDA